MQFYDREQNIPLIGMVTKFGKLFQHSMQLSATQPFNLIIDEFQDFFNINPAVYSDMQHDWQMKNDIFIVVKTNEKLCIR